MRRARMSNCRHNHITWNLDGANERGWSCVACHAPIGAEGFSPQHDRELITDKVEAVLMHMNHLDLVYMSNSDHGFGVVHQVVTRCRSENTYDQISIARFILEIEGNARHVKFWQDEARKVLNG